VKLALILTFSPSEGGTTVTITGTTTADGRVAELSPDAVSAATGRLLNRFVENLAGLTQTPPVGAGREPERETEPEREPEPEAEREPEAEIEPAPEPEPSPLFEEEEPAPTTPSRVNREDAVAEAAHARRTMIGRSAEEVDHAPPRGRYAPVPAPETATARATLRWAAPAAAVALASAIAVTRALRKRR
jgi:hypothetical protein